MQLKNTDLHYLLEQLGLTYNEAEVYLFLLHYGTKLGPEIYADLKMDKSSCYRALKNLMEKDLVYKVGEERNQQFSANPSDYLESLVRSEEKRLETTKVALNQFQSLITKYQTDQYKNKNITIINSPEGHRYYMEARLKCTSKLTRNLASQSIAAPFYDDYDAAMTDYITRRAEAKIFLRQLSVKSDLNSRWDRTSTEMYKEVRTLPDDFQTRATFSSWDDYSALFSIEDGRVLGFMVRDPLVTELLNSFFDYIWNGQEVT